MRFRASQPLDAGMTRRSSHSGGRRPKSAKARVAGSWAVASSERYGDLISALKSMVGGTRVRRHVRVCTHARSGGAVGISVAAGANQRANGVVIEVIGSREILAGLSRRIRNEKVGTIRGGLAER